MTKGGSFVGARGALLVRVALLALLACGVAGGAAAANGRAAAASAQLTWVDKTADKTSTTGAVPDKSPDGHFKLAVDATDTVTAITLATISGLMVALTVVLLFTSTLAGVHLATAIAIAFVAAMLALTAALFVFLIEVRFATATLRIGGHLDL